MIIKNKILQMIPNIDITGIYWHQLMFVIIGKSKRIIDKIRELNNNYMEKYPVYSIK